ncbi:SDR family NAD(P)-dependent oxidoreductase [Streptosporangium sp. 'caverna']|uniref:SDR family NAD(P)-dependent oxidoreductase n=1 Tax=Streptosporangium sp. 'caverna' TaxID=2202249 RepID=UPI000D7E0B7D|nr:SDR family NAD(P)-dependent oxidoreductase [Streptosporangium sp. 'caverna']AWS43469.1 short-chain dehydrogenase [Streptosporangium sp. 'caverna']
MDLQLTGKRALVTGSSSGLGEAIAKALATEGAQVVVHGRDRARTEAVADAIGAAGGSAVVSLGDLTTDDDADSVAETALAGGPIDILVNNVGAAPHRDWETATATDWSQIYELNVISGIRMIRRVVPRMHERGWGRVIQIGGGLGLQPTADLPHYNATLAARHNYTVSLARHLKGSGITSNAVAPGAILTDNARQYITNLAPDRGWGETWEEIERNAIEELVPNDVGRLGRAEEIAAAVLYLSGPLAAYVTGTTLRVDGGTIRGIH